MPGSIFQIARTGAAAARASIELTAQNIANVSNPDYARRSLITSEVVGQLPGTRGTLSGVRIDSISRNDSALIQQQARSSAGSLARADAELSALRETELALEQSQLFEGLVEFEAALTQLEGNPLEPALRTNALEAARQLATTFGFADNVLNTARAQVREAAGFSITEANLQTQELARINLSLASAQDGTPGQAALLDARDAALRDLAAEVGIETRFAATGAVEVRLAGSGGAGSGPLLVSGINATAITSTNTAGGTLEFAVGAVAVAPASGALAGHAAALELQADYKTQLDAIAASTIARSNAAQSSGAAADGSPGQPLFSGSNAGDIALALTSAGQLATAPAGSPAGSTNTTNLAAFVASIGAVDGPIAGADQLLLRLSSRIASQAITRSGLAVIAGNAQATLLSQTGVDLDTEAANLIRLQQAFEANGRVLQVAADIFDTLLGLR